MKGIAFETSRPGFWSSRVPSTSRVALVLTCHLLGHWEMVHKQFLSRAETWCEVGLGEVKLVELRLETCELRDSCHSAGRAVTTDDGRKGKGGLRGELVQSRSQRTR